MLRNQLDDQEMYETEIAENEEWIYSLDSVIRRSGPERAIELLAQLQRRAAEYGLAVPYPVNTPYVNTVPRGRQPRFPGNRDVERRIKSIVRWNAMAMVVRANREESGIGGHISTYASAATLYEVAFNHFLKGPGHPEGADHVYFQGHATPGIYARAFLEGRFDETHLENFRREMKPGGGLSSYPHPWLMPNFWQFPTVSMGLGPIMATYQARFNRYLEDRGLKDKTGRVWAFCGDGEMDEPESLGAISLAARENLDNLTFVVNCNLQRLDGPVRGNGKIIQELETLFRGAGWNVVKVIWGDDWDDLLDRDRDGVLVERMEKAVDGDYQKMTVSSGAYIREHFFGVDPRLLELVEHLTDEQLTKLRRGGHDPEKVYAAYKAAVEHTGAPTVILAKTVKGYGLGEAGEGKNVTHQQKKLNEQELREFRSRFGIPISDEDVGRAPFYKPASDSPEMQYLRSRREELGGFLPHRADPGVPLPPPPAKLFEEFERGSGDRDVATTMVMVRILGKLLKDEELGPRVVPVIPDEARTFGMDALFRQVGIYSHAGQKYEPVDKETLLFYNEEKKGQILEEGITEAGAMSSFLAAGTSYSTHGLPMIPFYFYYSMFGFQRIGDLIWAAGDMRARGFLVGGTAGRTTLAGEGLQHQDGHSHVLALPYPTVHAYDPAYAYEISVIVKEGMRRMFHEGEDVIFYLTVGNELYKMPEKPAEDVDEGIIKGLYRYRRSGVLDKAGDKKVHLWGSGAILNKAIEAQELLESEFDIAADVWSVTSYKELWRDAVGVERRNLLSPKAEPALPYVARQLKGDPRLVVAASDYSKVLPLSLAKWLPEGLVPLGTDGFGRSEGRAALRDFFEVDAPHIAAGAIGGLARKGVLDRQKAAEMIGRLDIDVDRLDPLTL